MVGNLQVDSIISAPRLPASRRISLEVLYSTEKNLRVGPDGLSFVADVAWIWTLGCGGGVAPLLRLASVTITASRRDCNLAG